MAKLQRWKRRDGAAEAPSDDGGADATDATEPAPEPDVVEVSAVEVDDPDTDPPEIPTDDDEATTRTSRVPRVVREAQVLAVLQAAHPRQALATGTFLGLAALAAGRPLREAAVVAATAVVGQAILGWHNDIVDRVRDARHGTPRKPVAAGRLEVGSAWYAVVLGVLLVIPLSITTGVTAGTFYLAALAVGLVGNVALRRGLFSWATWAVQFGLYVPYLSYGGWGGGADGDPPEPAMVVAFALLGVGVHALRSIWGLVADDEDRWTYLPLRLGRRLGATRLLAAVTAYLAVVLTVMAVLGGAVGLRQ